MAECLNDLNLQSLWECEISEEEEKYINDRIIPLNSMVRECYLKYMKQTLMKNLNLCPDSNNMFSQHDVEKCASFLELKALRLCMVTSLYQKAMLQMVGEIKKHTKESKLYYKLQEMLQKTGSCKESKCVATQTDVPELKVEELENKFENINNTSIKSKCENEGIFLSTNYLNNLPDKKYTLESGKALCKSMLDEHCTNSSNDLSILKENCINTVQCNIIYEQKRIENTLDSTEESETVKQLGFFLNEETEATDIGKVLLYDSGTQELIRILESDDENIEEYIINKNNDDESESIDSVNGISCSSYWKMQGQLLKKKLHNCISKQCCDPLAKVKMKNKFFNYFGYNSEEDDIWCSKEKIAKYKQRIAPWVVSRLIPYYRQKRITGRPIFKYVASHITDKLVSIHHFPEETDVEKAIILFFSYHGFISKAEDVWQDWDKELHQANHLIKQ